MPGTFLMHFCMFVYSALIQFVENGSQNIKINLSLISQVPVHLLCSDDRPPREVSFCVLGPSRQASSQCSCQITIQLVDQAIEVIVDKDTQTPWGTSRFSLKAGAVSGYFLAAEHHSALLVQLREMLQGNKSKLSHSELQSPRIQKYEEAVSAVVIIIQGWINPFDGIYRSKHAQTDKTQFIPNSSSHIKCCNKMFNTVNTDCEHSILYCDNKIYSYLQRSVTSLASLQQKQLPKTLPLT